MNVLETLGKLWQHGHGMFGWCSECGFPSRYWADVRAQPRLISISRDIDLAALIRQRGRNAAVVGLGPVACRAYTASAPQLIDQP